VPAGSAIIRVSAAAPAAGSTDRQPHRFEGVLSRV
jgi:hypothetical protein